MVSNEKLAQEGKKCILDTLKVYLRTTLPYLPEEGIEAVTKFLTSEELLAHVSFHIGTLDLVLTEVSYSNMQLFKKFCGKKDSF